MRIRSRKDFLKVLAGAIRETRKAWKARDPAAAGLPGQYKILLDYLCEILLQVTSKRVPPPEDRRMRSPCGILVDNWDPSDTLGSTILDINTYYLGDDLTSYEAYPIRMTAVDFVNRLPEAIRRARKACKAWRPRGDIRKRYRTLLNYLLRIQRAVAQGKLPPRARRMSDSPCRMLVDSWDHEDRLATLIGELDSFYIHKLRNRDIRIPGKGNSS